MLDELHVSNIALIEDATIAFAPGLTVLTGETGAGKTALLAASSSYAVRVLTIRWCAMAPRRRLPRRA